MRYLLIVLLFFFCGCEDNRECFIDDFPVECRNILTPGHRYYTNKEDGLDYYCTVCTAPENKLNWCIDDASFEALRYRAENCPVNLP